MTRPDCLPSWHEERHAMTDAKTLLLELLAVIPNGDKVAALFAEDGVVELPFLHAVGMPARHQGRARIKDFYDQVGKLYADFGFKPKDTKVLIETPDQVFAEYMTHTRAAGTGRLIHHLFAGRLVAEKGQIKLLRESLNVVAAVQALSPKGAAGLPVKSDGSFRQSPPRSSTASGTRFSSTPSRLSTRTTSWPIGSRAVER